MFTICKCGFVGPFYYTPRTRTRSRFYLCCITCIYFTQIFNYVVCIDRFFAQSFIRCGCLFRGYCRERSEARPWKDHLYILYLFVSTNWPYNKRITNLKRIDHWPSCEEIQCVWYDFRFKKKKKNNNVKGHYTLHTVDDSEEIRSVGTNLFKWDVDVGLVVNTCRLNSIEYGVRLGWLRACVCLCP